MLLCWQSPLVRGRVWTAGAKSSCRRPLGDTEQGTASGESKEVKSTGVAERLDIGVRERETVQDVHLGERWTKLGRLGCGGRGGMSSVALVNLACERRGTACTEAAGRLVARRWTRVHERAFLRVGQMPLTGA